MDRHKTALVLSGGGADSAYGVGVLKALARKGRADGSPIRPRIMTGTSAGAYNAAFLTSRLRADGFLGAVERLEETWRRRVAGTPYRCGNGVFRYLGDPVTALDPRCFISQPFQQAGRLAQDGAAMVRNLLNGVNQFVSAEEGDLVERLLNTISLCSLVTIEPLRQTIAETISMQAIRRAAVQLVVTAIRWSDGQMRLFRNQEFSQRKGDDIILASSAIPGFFPPVEIDGQPFVDGGVLMNTPLRPAIRAGADEIYITYFDPDVSRIPVRSMESTLDALYRTMVISWAARINRDVREASLVNRVIRHFSRDLQADPAALDFLQRVFGKRPGFKRRVLTIHRFHPRDDLGGALGILNFESGRVAKLIERGYRDTMEHDCQASGCAGVAADAPVPLYEERRGEGKQAETRWPSR